MSKIALRARLEELGVRPSKMLGQNFLLDSNLARAIVADSDPQEGDHLVEVGPGMGALTEHIYHSAASRITLIERDHRFVAELKRRYESDRVRVIAGDAAKVDLRELYGNGPIKVLGNLPYSASTAIIAHLTSALSPASSLVLMLQREVAERLAAAPGDEDYAALTILLGRRWCVKKTRIVPPDVFWPRPHVESAIVKITQRPLRTVQQCNETLFREIVRLGFSSRRKQLHSLLKIDSQHWLSMMNHLGYPATVRAEDLNIDNWSYLANQLAPLSSGSSEELFDVVNECDVVTATERRNIVHENKLYHRAVHLWIFNTQGELFLQKRSYWKENHPGLWCSSVAGHVAAGESYSMAAKRELQEELGVALELTPIFHGDSAAACESLVDTASVSHCSSGGMRDTTVVAMDRLPCLHEAAQRLATNHHEICELKPFYRIPASALTEYEFVECFYGVAEGPFTLNPEEIETGAFFSLNVIQDWIKNYPDEFTPLFKSIAKEFLNESKSLISPLK